MDQWKKRWLQSLSILAKVAWSANASWPLRMGPFGAFSHVKNNLEKLITINLASFCICYCWVYVLKIECEHFDSELTYHVLKRVVSLILEAHDHLPMWQSHFFNCILVLWWKRNKSPNILRRIKMNFFFFSHGITRSPTTHFVERKFSIKSGIKSLKKE